MPSGKKQGKKRGKSEGDYEFARIVECTTIPIFVIDRQHRIRHWNKAMENLTGIKKSYMEGTDNQWTLFYPGRRPILADLLIDGAGEEKIRKYYGGKFKESSLIEGAYEATDFFPKFGGKGKWLYFSAAPIKDPAGKVIGAIETAQDVTESKNADEQIRNLKEFSENIVESAPVGIIVVDSDGRITAWNRTQEKLSGIRKSEACGRIIYEGLLGGMKDVMKPSLEKALAGGRTSEIRGVGYRSTDTTKGSICDVSISPLVMGKKMTGAVITTKDVTEKRMLKEKVRMLEGKDLPFTEKDKKVLYGLVAYPYMNDIELSKELEIKRSTLTGIKNKLWRGGYYTNIVIPNLPALGFELMTVNYGTFNPAKDAKKAALILKEEPVQPEYVRIIATESEYFTVSVSRNITEYRKKRDPLEAEYQKNGLIKESSTVHFPFNISTMEHLFDYATPLRECFKLDEKAVQPGPKWNHRDIREPTLNEKQVMYELTRNPGFPDRETAKRVLLNKITVGHIRKRLIKDGFIHKTRIPDLRKIGCELIAVTHMRFNPATKSAEAEKAMSEEHKHATMYVKDMKEAIGLIPYRDYTEYKTESDRFMQIQNRYRTFLEDPKSLLIPAKKIRINKTDFTGILGKAMETG